MGRLIPEKVALTSDVRIVVLVEDALERRARAFDAFITANRLARDRMRAYDAIQREVEYLMGDGRGGELSGADASHPVREAGTVQDRGRATGVGTGDPRGSRPDPSSERLARERQALAAYGDDASSSPLGDR